MRITVCTPTYNRAYIIENLYQSLRRQTFTDFEWVVVDDGSSDDTENLFQEWIKQEDTFQIIYYKQKNSGKHCAVNKGLDLATGEIFFVVDSDDYLTDDALEKMDRWFREIDRNSSFAGIVANKGQSVKETCNLLFQKSYIDTDFLRAQDYKEDDKFVLRGERAIAFYTQIHRQYKYPVFENEKFVTEAVVYNRIAHDGYKMRYYNDIVWVYEYKEDGLTKSGFKLFLENPQGYGLWLREKSRFLKEGLCKRLRLYYSFTCDLKQKYGNQFIARCIETNVFVIAICRWINNVKCLVKGV